MLVRSSRAALRCFLVDAGSLAGGGAAACMLCSAVSRLSESAARVWRVAAVAAAFSAVRTRPQRVFLVPTNLFEQPWAELELGRLAAQLMSVCTVCSEPSAPPANKCVTALSKWCLRLTAATGSSLRAQAAAESS